MKYQVGDYLKIKVKSSKYAVWPVDSERIGIVLSTTDNRINPGYTLLIAGILHNCFLYEEDIQEKVK